MTSRVSPRSHSSASSSSASSSRTAYRNPSFGKARENSNPDPWVSDGRSARSAKQQQPNGGQWGQKPREAGRGWRHSGTPVAKESENMLSWKSQKPAIDRRSSFLNTGWASSTHQPEHVYEVPRCSAQSQATVHASENPWRHVNDRQQSFNAQQGRSRIEEPSWNMERLNISGQNQTGASKASSANYNIPILNFNSSQGHGPCNNSLGIHDYQTLMSNQIPENNGILNGFQQECNTFHPNFNYGSLCHSEKSLQGPEYSMQHVVLQSHSNSEFSRDQVYHRDPKHPYGVVARGNGANPDQFRPLTIRDESGNRNQEHRSYPSNFSDEFAVHFGKFSPISRDSAESTVLRGKGDTEYLRDNVAYKDDQNQVVPNSRGARAKSDQSQPLRSRVGEVLSVPSLSTNRQWKGMDSVITSWADECCDNDPQPCDVGLKGASDSHKTEWASSKISATGRLKDGNSSQGNLDAGFTNRHRRQESNRHCQQVGPSRANVTGKQSKQGDVSKKSVVVDRKVSIKHSVPIVPDEAAHKRVDNSEAGKFSHCVVSPIDAKSRQEAETWVSESYASNAGMGIFEDVALPFINGTCEDMCPLKEREQRERLRDLAVFERVSRNPGKTSRQLAVKKFCRTLSSVKLLSDDVRPLRVLWNTQQYLLNLLDDTEFSFDVVHNFLFDRTRAIRQELGMQRIANRQAINMYEEIVRFHILSEHELNQRVTGRNVSDSHLNLEQLSKCLLSLFDLYRVNCNGKSTNEAEFRAYYVILNLDSSKNHQADALSVWFCQFPASLLNSWEVKFARAVLRCYRAGNYKAFFQFAKEATFLQSCLMEIHFNKVRVEGLMSMNQGGYKLHPIPLADIAKQLLMKEGDLEELCNLCGLSASMDPSKVRCLFTKQAQFSAPKELPSYRCPCIINKRPLSYFEEVTGTRQRL